MSGPRAFPLPQGADCTDVGTTGDRGGMTLRDYFAAQAVDSALANTIWTGDENEKKRYADAAKLAYQIADAMLAERERKP